MIHYQLAEIHQIARGLIAKYWSFYRVYCLCAPMGSGKTTLTSALLQQLGVEQVQSPTFGIVHTYPVAPQQQIHHYDLYRLRDSRELIELGIEEQLNSEQDYCLIEWPDLLLAKWQGRRIEIHLNYVDEQTRSMTIYEFK